MKTKTRGTAPTANSKPSHARLIKQSTPVAGKPVVAKFEVRTPWVKVSFKMLAEDAAELWSLPPIPFEDLGSDVWMNCYPAALEIRKGTDRISGGKSYWLKTHAEDWMRCIRGKHLDEMQIKMPEQQWQMMQVIAERLEVPTDALIRAGIYKRLVKLREFYKERGKALGGRPAATTSKGGRP